MKFKKKNFKEKYTPSVKEEEVDELHEPDGDFGGDKPKAMGDTQIGSNTPKSFDSKSDFEPDIPTVLDKMVANTRTPRDFSNVWGTSRFQNGSYRGIGTIGEGIDEDTKARVTKIVKELLSKRNSDNDFVTQSNNMDVNSDNIDDIEQLGNPQISSLAKELVTSLSGLDDKSKTTVLNYINNSTKQ